MRFKVAMLLTLFCAGFTVNGQDKSTTYMTVFGLKLGQKFTLPECRRMKITKNHFVYSGGDSDWCYQRIDASVDEAKEQPITNATVLISFPFADRPQLVSGLSISGQVLDGNLEGIGFNTLGVRDSDEILSALTEKYGKPTAKDSSEVKTQIGATFPRILASWKLPNLVIVFQSITTQINSGLVTIDSVKCREWRDATLKRLTNEGRPL